MTDYFIRMSLFLLVMISLLGWQYFRPFRQNRHWRSRWFENIALLVIDSILVRLIQPVLLSLFAYAVFEYGLLNALPIPYWASIVVGLFILDIAIYWQHRWSHHFHWIWRLHRVHHSDAELDVTSAIRFHPLEIILSLIYKGAIVLLFGIPPETILIFDIVLNASAMLNHSNIKFRSKTEYWLRLFIVTPEMHRIHHSRNTSEANSNYSSILSIWDKVFNSYIHRPVLTDENLNIGLPSTKNYRPKDVLQLLLMPLFDESKFK